MEFTISFCEISLIIDSAIHLNAANMIYFRYSAPTVTSIGRVYQTLILNVRGLYDIIVEAIKKYLVHLLVMRYLILIQVCITAIQII